MATEGAAQRLCACGCGKPLSGWMVRNGKQYRKGHARRYLVKQGQPQTFCACGCGILVPPRMAAKGAKYAVGHSPKSPKQTKLSDKPCACGCGRLLPVYMVNHKYRYLRGHMPKIRPIRRDPSQPLKPRLCDWPHVAQENMVRLWRDLALLGELQRDGWIEYKEQRIRLFDAIGRLLRMRNGWAGGRRWCGRVPA